MATAWCSGQREGLVIWVLQVQVPTESVSLSFTVRLSADFIASSHVFGSAWYKHRRSGVPENILAGHLKDPWATISRRAAGNGGSKKAEWTA